MRALIWNGTAAEVAEDRPESRLRPEYVLVKTIAVALNPTDSKAVAQGRAAKDGLLGCDFAGTILAIGEAVSKKWRKGDRVFGCVHGANFNNAEDGAFAETIVAKGDTCMRIPDHMSFEEACTLGVSVLTCGQGLFQKMKLDWPSAASEPKRRESVLFYGGSSSTGMVGIQLCRQ
jgi:NADPH:quinone reductase-like Zn-dependent oxidoreductase